ncbi:MAG: 3-deoxy-manno-octulosonate cytidylyltransferase [Gammaproteobacteria bacterium]
MTVPFKVYIPARYASTRLPGKLLIRIDGKPLLQHVFEASTRSGAREVVVATDDARIEEAAAGFGAAVVATGVGHASGTERLSEAVTARGEPEDMVIVNVQGDEFGIPPEQIDQVAALLHGDGEAAIATLYEAITDEADFRNPNIVKVVFDRNGHALYFSRSPIPDQHPDTAATATFSCPPYRHIGIYAYRAGFLRHYAGLPPCGLEKSERLEQLRALYNGYVIRVAEACVSGGLEVNTEADLERARSANAGMQGQT